MKLGQVGRQLNDVERGQLMGLIKLPGFEVLRHIFEEELEEMNIELINVPSANEREIIAKHQMAKAAAMFYARVMARVTQEEGYFGAKVQEQVVQPDMTESLLQF